MAKGHVRATSPVTALARRVGPLRGVLARQVHTAWRHWRARSVERALGNVDPNDWLSTSTALVELAGRDRAGFHLLELALGDRRAAIRAAAIEALGSVGDRRAVPAIVAALDDEDFLVRTVATEELRRFGPAAVGGLSRALRHPSPRVRASVAELLGSLECADAVPPLIAALDDEVDLVVARAAEALGSLRAAAAVPPLRRLLRADDWSIRAAAATALGLIGDASSETALRELLADSDWDVRQDAARALARIHAHNASDLASEPVVK
ncbi:MAG: HEAT repeat domain-containing protein [Chloroflexi bacterium]|nr:HEAT repeat domain-containing protein [Chloroflexota bacterium]